MFIGQQPKAQIIADYARYVNPGRASVHQQLGLDIVPGRREGVWVWDVDGGRKFINCRCGEIFGLGHRPPRVVAALKSALDEVDVGDHLLLDEQRAALGKRMAQLTPGDIQYSTFSPGGAEAIEVALKLARGYTRRAGVISVRGGYHGHTGFALATGEDWLQGKFVGPMPPGFSKVPFGDAEALEAAVNEETAAVIIETLPATAGILIPPDDYYPRTRAICDTHGAQLIIDEVQTGLGRTGRMWAIEEWGVVPDILVAGKSLGGSVYPISATCHRPHLDAFFRENPFIHVASFGGSALGCVAALATLDQISEPGFMQHVQTMGERFERGFVALRARYPSVAGWRRRGLMIGFELAEPPMGPALAAALAQNGVLAIFAKHRPSTLQIKPPLIIQPGEVDFVLEAMDRALGFLTAHPEIVELIPQVGVM